jgi:large subunit ribosomal protein L28
MKGNNVAHSKLRTKRDFSLNLKRKKFWSEEEQRFVTLRVSCKGMRIIRKNGLEATVKEAQKKGYVNLV